MYNELKSHWSNQYALSSNKAFTEFLYYFQRGGIGASQFLAEEGYLLETVAGSPAEVAEIEKFIENDKEASENQAYFFATAMKMLAKLRGTLRNKFEASRVLCEKLGIPIDDLSPETLLPMTRMAEEGNSVEADTDSGEDSETNEAEGSENAAKEERVESEDSAEDAPATEQSIDDLSPETETESKSEEAPKAKRSKRN